MSLARLRALVIFGVLVLAAAVAVTWTLMSDNQQGTASSKECPPHAKRASLTIPEEKDVKINVYNTTDRNGLAQATASKLKGVGFHILAVKQDPKGSVVHDAAQLRYGRKAVGSAQLLRAYVAGATTAYDPERDDDTVDVVIGDGFSDVRGPTDVKEAEISLGEPSAPPGTC
ncbi:MAG: LytR C-terminal domain-containing protein [Actinocatenispora sp.]